MHNYIDINILRDYSKPLTLDDVYNDVENIYNITNIFDDEDYECLTAICNALYTDYTVQRANYHAYIERGMNARMLMELRKSAVIPMDEELFDFYTKHSSCETYTDVKNFRSDYLKFLCSDYQDLNWQYHYLILHYLRGKAKDFFFDYEICFADGDPSKQTDRTDYDREFFNAHMPTRLWKEK